MAVMTSTEFGVMPGGRVNAVGGGCMIEAGECVDEDGIILVAGHMGSGGVGSEGGDMLCEEDGESSVGNDGKDGDAGDTESDEGSGGVEVISHTEACSLPFP